MLSLPRVQLGLAALLVALVLVFGGGQGTLGDTACQGLALVLAGLGFHRHAVRRDARWPRAAWLAALVPGLVAFQFLPLPDALAAWAPARAELQAAWAEAGVRELSRVTLVPLATERALAWCLPGLALFLTGLQLAQGQQRLLLWIALGGAIASIPLGLLQASAGGPAWHPYASTNPGSAVGLFANRNHFASLLAMMVPIVLLGAVQMARERRRAGESVLPVHGVGLGLLLLLMIGLVVSGSRAGLLLALVGVALSTATAWLVRRRRARGAAWALGGGSLALALAAGLLVLARPASDPGEESRLVIWSNTAKAAQAHSPWGVGLGGFRRAYEVMDEAPGREYINHAHSDLLELWLEAGIAGLLALAAALWAFLRGGRACMARALAGSGRALIGVACWLSLLLALLHSLVDYPLRTTALLALAGLLAALVATAANPRESTSPLQPET